MTDHHATSNPFDGMYDPTEDDLPVMPPVGSPPAGLPVPPVQPFGGEMFPPVSPAPSPASLTSSPHLPTRPVADGPAAPPAAGGVPTRPSATPTQPIVPAPTAPAAAAPGAVPIPVPIPQPRTHQDGPVLPSAASTPGVEIVAEGDDEEKIVLDELLITMVEKGGSDLHLTAGSPPVIRVRGEMQAISGYGPLTPKQLQDAMYSVMSGKQRSKFEEKLELDFAYTVPGQARFRVNVMKQRGSVGAVMRTIPWEILSLDALGLPEIIGDFANLPRGLVLVTGPTGSGKSTTLAAIIDRANRTRSGHIITIEDPVEFLHEHRGCVVNQREVGEDTHSFQDALKHVLRQDPDIILVGELRDLETISVALTAAETGHLVFATLHTQSAAETITRIIDVFPAAQQAQVQTQLAASLQGVVCQTLCKTADGSGRQAAVEIMVGTPNIRSLIREKKLQQVQSALQSGGKFGMQTLNMDLAKHVASGRITYDVAVEKASDKEDFDTLVGGRAGAEAATRRAATQVQHGMGGYAPPPVG